MKVFRKKGTLEFHSAVGEGVGVQLVPPDPAVYEAIEIKGMEAQEFSETVLGPAYRSAGSAEHKIEVHDGKPNEPKAEREVGRLPTGHTLRMKGGTEASG